MVPWALPQVYDYMEGWDATSVVSPLQQEVYNRKRYLTCYGKEQKTSFGTIYIDRGGGTPDSYTGIASISDYMTVLGEGATATFNFTIEQAGTYDIAVRLAFPFWDKNALNVAVGRKLKDLFGEPPVVAILAAHLLAFLCFRQEPLRRQPYAYDQRRRSRCTVLRFPGMQQLF